MAHIIAFLPYPVLAGCALAVGMCFTRRDHTWTIDWYSLARVWGVFLALVLMSIVLSSSFQFSRRTRERGRRLLTALFLTATAFSGLALLPASVAILNTFTTKTPSWPKVA
jgi:hypothetical protein